MAWGWSHTAQAYVYAESQLRAFDRDTLLEIAAEWRMHKRFPGNDHDWQRLWPQVLANVRKKYRAKRNSEIALAIWLQAEDQALCDNGGFNAWMCPYGCLLHCVPFSPEDLAEPDFSGQLVLSR